jgi:hypothetical protein
MISKIAKSFPYFMRSISTLPNEVSPEMEIRINLASSLKAEIAKQEQIKNDGNLEILFRRAKRLGYDEIPIKEKKAVCLEATSKKESVLLYTNIDFIRMEKPTAKKSKNKNDLIISYIAAITKPNVPYGYLASITLDKNGLGLQYLRESEIAKDFKAAIKEGIKLNKGYCPKEISASTKIGIKDYLRMIGITETVLSVMVEILHLKEVLSYKDIIQNMHKFSTSK